MYHPIFSIAVFQRPTHRAFGLDLLPLTLGHVFLLRECRCKLLLRGVSSDLGDLLLAAFVCASDHVQARKHLSLIAELDQFIDAWAEICRDHFTLSWEIKKFFAWWHENFEFPEVTDPLGGGKPAPDGVPGEWLTLAFLMTDCHMTRRLAYATELAFATALWAAHGHRAGRHQVEEFGAGAVGRAAWEHQHKLDLAAAAKRKAEKEAIK